MVQSSLKIRKGGTTMKTAVIIPVLNPDHTLAELVAQIRKISDAAVVIVNDGSEAGRRSLYAQLEDGERCIVTHHPRNLGKGAAVKTGIRLAMETYPDLECIVTADAGFKYRAEDIVRVSNSLLLHPEGIVLGIRDFSAPQIPFQRRFGNRFTSLVFRLCTHVGCSDTRTGLRAFPAGLAEFCLSVPGEQYEYEMNLLLAAAREHIPFTMLPVSWSRCESGRSPRFPTARDSALILGNIFRFLLRSGRSAFSYERADA